MRQRLVGAIVLVALAVIFLPMLFDGSGRPEQLDVAVEIPDKPEAPASSLDDVPLAEPAAQPESTAEPAASSAADTTSDQETAVPASDATSADQGEPASSPGDGAEQAGEGGAAATDGGGGTQGPGAWVVQVGSFSRETNAVVLRDRLRQKGFDAFTEQGESDGQAVWRVRVGPVATRADAEDLQAKIEKERGKDALVMTYP